MDPFSGPQAVAEAPKSPLIEANAPPSSYAIADLVAGRVGALRKVVTLTLLRAVFILPAMALIGRKGRLKPGEQVVGALVTSASISLGMFLLYHVRAAIEHPAGANLRGTPKPHLRLVQQP